MFAKCTTTVDGFEYTFALNHLAYFLMTSLLLPNLKAADHARVINVFSSGNNLARVRWDDLQYQSGYAGFLAYCRSKLRNALFSNALARRLQHPDVTSNSLHPGVVRTGFGRAARGVTKVVSWAANLGAISVEQGARTSLSLATSPELTGVTGRYFVKQKSAQANRVASDGAPVGAVRTTAGTLAGF